MPMDGIMLGFISRELSELLTTGRVDKVTQPERDEIHITIRCQGQNQRLLLSASANHARIHLTQKNLQSPLEPPMFCMLLRKHLQSGRITAIRQINGDRIIELDIENIDELGDISTRTLSAELMGRHSNIILRDQQGKIIDSIRHISDQISRVREVLPGLPYELPPQQDKLRPQDVTEAALRSALSSPAPLAKTLQALFMGFSAQTAREMVFRMTGDIDTRGGESLPSAAIKIGMEFLSGLSGPPSPTLILDPADDRPIEVFPFEVSSVAGEKRKKVTVSEALDEFYMARARHERIEQKSAALSRVLQNNIERCEKKLSLQLEALQNSDRMDELRLFGDLLTANLYRIKKGDRQATLENYYDETGATITIPLDESKAPNENAQRYYKLFRKAKQAKTLAADQKAATEEELLYLLGQQDNLKKCVEEAELTEIREELEREGYVRATHNRRTQKKLPPSKPYHYRSSDGIDIFVGKNNIQNDRLTQEAEGETLWLHVKNMPGSHIIAKCSCETAPEQTLREAALLAAFYSKGRMASQVPIDYTARKYVKKPGGAKPGYVIYTNQRTLYVTPTDEAIGAITLVSN